jgi:spore coat protein A
VIDRRQFLTGGSAAVLGLASLGNREVAARTVVPFRVPLPMPRVLQPERSDTSNDYYQIVQRETLAEILPGIRTRIWGYNGSFPGPTIEARRGRTTVVTHTNRLGVATVVHLHGGVTTPESDGFPTDSVAPGETR